MPTEQPEPHKIPTGSTSECSIVWSPDGHYIVMASPTDHQIYIHDAVSPDDPPKTIPNVGVTALAISPDSTCLVAGSNSVKFYEFPSGDYKSNITRFTLPVRSLAFDKSANILAAAGDDKVIKLVNTFDGSIAQVLEGHKRPVTSLAFDPKNEFLASIDSGMTVILWELQHGNIKSVYNGSAPNRGFMRMILDWSPDGEMLAVPGLNGVVMYDRKLNPVRGPDTSCPDCFLSWSPNRKYMVTSNFGSSIFMRDVASKQIINYRKFTECLSSCAWKPDGNALAVIDVMGKFLVWESSWGMWEWGNAGVDEEDILGVSKLSSKKRSRDKLFDNVAKEYDEVRLARPELALHPRTADSLCNRMMTIKKDIADFVVYYDEAERLLGNNSGYNEDDVEARALQLYFNDKGKHMPCFHAWKFIRQFPDWRRKINEGLPCAETDNDNEQIGCVKRYRDDCDGTKIFRKPIGRNDASEAQSDENSESSSQSHNSSRESPTESRPASHQALLANSEIEKGKLAVENRRLAIEENKLELEEVKLASREKDRKMKFYFELLRLDCLNDEQKEIKASLEKEFCVWFKGV